MDLRVTSKYTITDKDYDFAKMYLELVQTEITSSGLKKHIFSISIEKLLIYDLEEM